MTTPTFLKNTISAGITKLNPMNTSEQWLQAILQAFPTLLFHLDDHGTILGYKSSPSSLFYLPVEDILGKKVQDVLPPDMRGQTVKALDKVNQTGGTACLEYTPSARKEGCAFEARFVHLPGSEILMIAQDISKRKEAETQVQRHFQRSSASRVIDAVIAGSFDLKHVIKVILEQVMQQLKVDAADVLLNNPLKQTLEWMDGRGFRSRDFKDAHLRAGEGYAGRVILERKTIHVSDLRTQKTEPLHSRLFTQESFVAYLAAPLIVKGQVRGVLETFFRSPFTPDLDWLDFFESLASQTAIAIDNASLFEDLQRSNIELTLAYDYLVEGLARTLDLYNHESEGHNERVAEMTVTLASIMGISENNLGHIRRGALLHDLGKVGIPGSILSKAEKLTEAEWNIIRQHPQYAYDLLYPIPRLRPALDIPYCHHEKWDGTGYPRGLKGDEIPLVARMFAISDVYDALTCNRSYRAAWPKEKAFEYVCSGAGTHFDPLVIEVVKQLKTDWLQSV